jgi:molybdopterin-guanine dinucleotide biosynthesis protein A
MNRNPSAVILVGGGSLRYGEPKHAALWQGETFLDHVLSGLPPERTETVVVSRRGQDIQPGPFTVFHDSEDLPPGPLRGLITGLEACSSTHAWVVACDLPGLDPNLLRHLRTVWAAPYDAVVPRWEGRLQPLCAFYSRSSATPLRAAAEAGVRSIIGAFESLSVREVAENDARLVDPGGRSLLNINRQEDLDLLGREGPSAKNDGDPRK